MWKNVLVIVRKVLNDNIFGVGWGDRVGNLKFGMGILGLVWDKKFGIEYRKKLDLWILAQGSLWVCQI